MSWFATFEDWRLMGKLSNELSKRFMSLSVRRIVSLRMIPGGKKKRMIPGGENDPRIWNVIHLGMGTKSSGWSCVFFSIMPAIMWLCGFIALCPLWLVLCCSSLRWTFEGCCFSYFLNLKNLALLYSGFCWLKTDNWTKLKFTFWCLSPDEESGNG